jgi:hypothetical protein
LVSAQQFSIDSPDLFLKPLAPRILRFSRDAFLPTRLHAHPAVFLDVAATHFQRRGAILSHVPHLVKLFFAKNPQNSTFFAKTPAFQAF